MRHARGKHGVGHGVVGYAPVTIERCEAAGVQTLLAVELKQREPFAGQPEGWVALSSQRRGF